MQFSLNLEKINELKEIDEDGSNETLIQVIQLFIVSTPKKLTNMQDHLHAQDWIPLKKEAHSLRSSALVLGADKMAHLAREIEYCPESSEAPKHLASYFLLLNSEWEAVKESLNSYL